MHVNREDLQKFIKQHLLNKDGKLKKLPFEQWFVEHNCHDVFILMIAETSFLAENSCFSERAYCVMNNIFKQFVCENCGKNSFFAYFTHGYKRFCNSVCKKQFFRQCIKQNKVELCTDYEVLNRYNVISFIQDNFYKQNGRLKNLQTRRLIPRFYEICYFIHQQVEFLVNVTENEELFCFLNNINEIQICKFCNESKLEFANIAYGYQKSCQKAECQAICQKLSLSVVEENGFTIHQNLTRRMMIPDENGETERQRISKRAVDTMKNTILSTGLTICQTRTQNMLNTKRNNVDEFGQNDFGRNSLKAAQTRKNTISSNGLTIQQNSILNSKKTLEQNALNNLKVPYKCKILRYEDTMLVFQGSLEKKFLDFINSLNLLEKMQRGQTISYVSIDNKQHYYFPDFQIADKIFEVKCKWSYDRDNKNLDYRAINNSKFKAVLDAGKEIYVVWDSKFLHKINISCLSDLCADIYQPNDFIELNQENFLNIYS